MCSFMYPCWYLKGTNITVIWELSGDQGNKWLSGQLPFYSSVDYILLLEAVHGGGYKGDMGLDDISLTNGQCQSKSSCFAYPCSPR